MKRQGEILFAAAFVVALVLYGLTAADGLPWNASAYLSLAYLGEIVRLPAMPHPVWGYYVQVFGGPVALSVFMAALAAGLLASLVCRYFGWRFAVSAALVWTFFPGVWNRAITGERGICLAAMVIVAIWVLNAILLCVLRKAREVRAARRSAPTVADGDGLAISAAHEGVVKRGRANRLAGWAAMGVAGVFAVISLTLHDYRYGEAASAFARGVVEAAGKRVIVMNGVCDGQIVREVKRLGEGEQWNLSTGATSSLVGAAGVRVLPQHNKKADVHCPPPPLLSTLSLRNDDAYRTNLVRWVRSAFPSETNFWVAAQVSPQAFAGAATKKFPDRFCLMNGKSTTLAQWEKRWEAFKPYLGSSDPFVPVARRMFGFEGNSIANAMLESGEGRALRSRSTVESSFDSAGQYNKEKSVHCRPRPLTSTSDTAWRLYKRIYDEIDPKNFSALVNMSEMVRRGHAVSGEEKKWVQEKLESFFKDPNNRKHMRQIARTAGPVRADPALMEKMAEEAKKRIAAKIAAGEKVEYSPETLSLVEWSNEMCQRMDKNELVKAGRIARAILSNPKWRGFVPANAVMGSVAAFEGDSVASERFFQVATDTTNAVPSVVLNNYADTLMRLGKLDEAEKIARRAVGQSDEKFWLARLTLAEVLETKVEKRGGGGRRNVRSEINDLLKSVLKHAPEKVRERVRKERGGSVR